MKTLFDLIKAIPADRTAIVIPESNLRVSYGAFRDQIVAVAEALAAAAPYTRAAVNKAVRSVMSYQVMRNVNCS